MSIFFVNTQNAQISNAFIATLGAAPGSTYLAEIKAAGLIPSVQAMITATGSSTAAALSTKVATNLGLTGTAFTGGTAYLGSVTFAGASSTWAANLMSTLDLFTTLQFDAIYGSAATAYLARVNSAVSYSVVATNNSTDLSTLAAAVGSAGSTGSGSTFTLTTGIDNPPGTSGNDLLLGNLIGTAVAAGSTVSVGDTINLGAGIDTFKLTTTAATAISAANMPLLTNVEILSLNALSAATSFVGTLAPSLTTLVLDTYAAASAVTVTVAPTTLRTIEINNSTQDVNDLTVTFAANATSGSADSILFKLTNVDATADFDTADDPTIILEGAAAGVDSGIETISFNVTGTNKIDVLSSIENNTGLSALKNITVTGSGSLAIATALATDVGGRLTVDASSNTGGVTMSVGTTQTTFTGGSGNDSVRFGTAGDLDANDVINLGGGSNTIRIADTAMSSTTLALNTAVNAITTAQTVEFSAAVTGLDMSVLTAQRVGSVGNANLTATKQSATDLFIISGAGAARTLTINGAIGHTTANLEYKASNTVASTSLATSVSGNSTINIVSTSDSTTLTNTTGTFTPAVNSTINVSGNGNITFGTTAGTGIALGAASFVNAAELTGNLTVTGAAAANILTGGSGADTIIGGAASDTLNGGAGIDTITTGANATGTGDTVRPGLGADFVIINYVATAATHTMSYNATAAESFSTAVSTAITNMDTLTLHNVESAGASTNTITFTTGVISGQSGALTVTSNAVVMGTTTVAANGFLVFSASAAGANSPEFFVYQDTDGDGIVEAGEFAIKIIGSTEGADLEAFSVSAGKLVLLATGAA